MKNNNSRGRNKVQDKIEYRYTYIFYNLFVLYVKCAYFLIYFLNLIATKG